MPKFYLATRKDLATQAEKLLEALKSRGWERTFTWAGEDKAGAEEYPELALAELAGVREADVLIVLLPGGYGTHVEIGAALAWGKPVILHSPDRKTLENPYPWFTRMTLIRMEGATRRRSGDRKEWSQSLMR